MKRDTRKAYRARAAATERLVDGAVAEIKAERDERLKQARDAAAKAEAERVHLTRDDILGATHVRTRYGWHKVAKVNTTTVAVETGYSWTDKYPFSKVLEVRRVSHE